MRLPDLPPAAADAIRGAGTYVSGLLTPTLRLGVTGLARAGKTVFITALVRNLVCGGRLPFFSAMADGRIVRAYLQPQPDDAVPRFDYESHVRTLERDLPEWPASTRRISQLRLVVEYIPAGRMKQMLGPSRLNIDIVDYPGEWLIDLPMMTQDFAAWSAEALAAARAPVRAAAASGFLAYLDGIDPAADPETVAIEGARRFTAYLRADRERGAPSILGPGRFLLPGDLEGAPLLTFFPLAGDAPPEPLRALLAHRFEKYKKEVVRPFYKDHFARLDRQIVLVDALSAIQGGADAVQDLERALTAVLQSFRPGALSWLYMLLGRRIDRLVFAASKADHLPSTSHDRLEAILAALTERAAARATDAGADVKVLALAALRSTREAHANHDGERLPCLVGTPLPGERIGAERFDGLTETAIFPGDLPSDPAVVLGPDWKGHDDALALVRFRPARLGPAAADGTTPAAPHIRLDRALEFLIGDRLS